MLVDFLILKLMLEIMFERGKVYFHSDFGMFWSKAS